MTKGGNQGKDAALREAIPATSTIATRARPTTAGPVGIITCRIEVKAEAITLVTMPGQKAAPAITVLTSQLAAPVLTRPAAIDCIPPIMISASQELLVTNSFQVKTLMPGKKNKHIPATATTVVSIMGNQVLEIQKINIKPMIASTFFSCTVRFPASARIFSDSALAWLEMGSGFIRSVIHQLTTKTPMMAMGCQQSSSQGT